MWERIQEKRNEGGFTLIELLIVIIILAILAAIVVFAVGTTGKNAAVASCDSDAKSIETAVEAFHAQTLAYPAAVGDLTASTVTGGSTVGPWLRTIPGTTHYIISLTTSGTILVTAPTTAVAGVNFDSSPDPCQNAS